MEPQELMNIENIIDDKTIALIVKSLMIRKLCKNKKFEFHNSIPVPNKLEEAFVLRIFTCIRLQNAI